MIVEFVNDNVLVVATKDQRKEAIAIINQIVSSNISIIRDNTIKLEDLTENAELAETGITREVLYELLEEIGGRATSNHLN